MSTKYYGHPVIHIKLESMRGQIHSMMTLEEQYITEEVKRAVDEAVREFDFAQAIKEQVFEQLNMSITESVKSFFRYGEGKKVINEVAERAVQAALVEKENWYK